MADQDEQYNMSNQEHILGRLILAVIEEFRATRGYIATNDFLGGEELYHTELFVRAMMDVGNRPRTVEGRRIINQLAREAHIPAIAFFLLRNLGGVH